MNDWAVILGASSGIGAKCAMRLAKKGINIYGLYLRKKQAMFCNGIISKDSPR